MSKEILKMVCCSTLGLAAYAMSNQALAQSCDPASATSSQWDCVQYQDSRGGLDLTYHAAPTNQWFGYNSGDTSYNLQLTNGNTDNGFIFYGTNVDLVTPLITVSCNLALKGQLRYEPTSTGKILKIQVVDGGVTSGDTLCSGLTLGGFPWWADTASNFSASGGFPQSSNVHPPATGLAIGNIGGTIKVTHPLLGTICDGGTMEDVEFRNGNPISDDSSFTFNNTITGTSCGVDGILYSEEGFDANAW
ncbi:hypothetical protein [Alcanivorax xiamenensis]|uniref:hypothetical protein n=1 Tax=Alcanivorax xiamenensis TaxID=1177156 RepID=UPI00135B8A7A|nr:hypothetical protein [Alcanivorax xiamenensis]